MQRRCWGAAALPGGGRGWQPRRSPGAWALYHSSRGRGPPVRALGTARARLETRSVRHVAGDGGAAQGGRRRSCSPGRSGGRTPAAGRAPATGGEGGGRGLPVLRKGRRAGERGARGIPNTIRASECVPRMPGTARLPRSPASRVLSLRAPAPRNLARLQRLKEEAECAAAVRKLFFRRWRERAAAARLHRLARKTCAVGIGGQVRGPAGCLRVLSMPGGAEGARGRRARGAPRRCRAQCEPCRDGVCWVSCHETYTC